ADDALAALARGRASGSGKLVAAATIERQVRRSGAVRSRASRLVWWVAGGLAVVAAALQLARLAGLVGTSVAFVRNVLVEPVELLRNGTPVDTVRPGGTARLARLRDGAGTELSWRLLRPGN